jgi:hypothetical protein
MASARKKDRSALGKRAASAVSRSKRSRTVSQSVSESSAQFAVCVRNDEYPASLEVRKLYRVLEDRFASEHAMVRVIDESGEDYLFPSEYFVRINLPQAIEKQLSKIA